jgi:hypothetical protein
MSGHDRAVIHALLDVLIGRASHIRSGRRSYDERAVHSYQRIDERYRWPTPLNPDTCRC